MALDRAAIAARLRQEISEGQYAVGERLPGQRDLATTYGAAPNTVGEALRLLATEGIVKIRSRSGVVVQDPHAVEVVADPLGEARTALADAQGEVRKLRNELGELDRRITRVLDRIDDSE